MVVTDSDRDNVQNLDLRILHGCLSNGPTERTVATFSNMGQRKQSMETISPTQTLRRSCNRNIYVLLDVGEDLGEVTLTHGPCVHGHTHIHMEALTRPVAQAGDWRAQWQDYSSISSSVI